MSQAQAELIFTGTSDQVFSMVPAASTGLDAVYVVRDSRGIEISYSSGSSVKWSRFLDRGAAYAEEIGIARSISLQDEDAGYVAEVDGRSHYYWIVNYANHQLSLNGISLSSEQDCDRISLDISGIGDRMTYYTINGRGEELSRSLSLCYNTLEYDAESNSYRQVANEDEISYVKPLISVSAPLCDTRFTLSGDRFLESWGAGQSVESPIVPARFVSAETSAEQKSRDVTNEQRVDGVTLGGSAPCEIDFTAAVSDAAVFYEWQLSRNSDFDPIDDRYSSTDLNYSFRDQGTTYVRFVAADESGECQYFGAVYEVEIGESSLLCPNAFSPQSSPGVNDEWKVSYKSIISFECHIFNRWGIEMISFSDPSSGWDGKYKGKYVPAGTYYYVIQAKGADGREYKLSGDINIINSSSNATSSQTPSTGD